MTSTLLVDRFLSGHSLRMLADEMGTNADSAERHLRAGLIEIAESAAHSPDAAAARRSPTPREARKHGADSSPRPPRVPNALLGCNRAMHRAVYQSLSEGAKSLDGLGSDCMMSLPDLDACVRWLAQHGYIAMDVMSHRWYIVQEVAA